MDLNRFEKRWLLRRSGCIIPEFVEAPNNRGIALAALKRHQETLLSYNAALSLDPNSARALNNRANTLHGLGRHEDALGDYDTALALSPNLIDSLIGRGCALHKLARWHEVGDAFRRAIELKPISSEARYNLDIIHIELGQYPKAEAMIQGALKLTPRNLTHFAASPSCLCVRIAQRRPKS